MSLAKPVLDPQLEALQMAARYVVALRRKTGRGPSMEEIDARFGFHSKKVETTRRIPDRMSPSKLQDDLLCDLSASALLDELLALPAAQLDNPSRKAEGVAITPSWLATLITREALKAWSRLHRTSSGPKMVGDTSCGTGAFLVALDKQVPEDATIVGKDINRSFIDYCRLVQWATGSRTWDLRCVDSLTGTATTQPRLPFSPNASPDEKLDLIVGNPPYVRSSVLDADTRARLRDTYLSAQAGAFDLSALFIEHTLASLADGGVASLLVSSKFIQAKYGASIRRTLSSVARVVSILDFGDEQIFPRLSTYTCVISFAKLPMAKRFTRVTFPTGILETKSLSSAKSESLPSSALAHDRWDLLTGPAIGAARKLSRASLPQLLDVFGSIYQGVRTGANPVFLPPPDVLSALENGITMPFVKGEDIKECGPVFTQSRILFPYRRSLGGRVLPLKEQELQENYPRAWQYLQSKKPELLERSASEGTPWYCFSRAQNLERIFEPKIFVREMFPSAVFSVDFKGEYVFGAGYALSARTLTTEEILLWATILSSKPMEYAMRQVGTQLQSGWFRLMKHHLLQLRVPVLNQGLRSELTMQAKSAKSEPHSEKRTQSWNPTDTAVAHALSLSDDDCRLITTYLQDCHRRSLGQSRTPAPADTGGSTMYEPVRLDEYTRLHRERPDLRQLVTFKGNKALPIHRWYKYTQGYSHQLVEGLLHELNISGDMTVLDPFLGCGTTTLTCKQAGIKSIGCELSPLMALVARVKTADYDARELEGAFAELKRSKWASIKVNLKHIPFITFLERAYHPRILTQIAQLLSSIRGLGLAETSKNFLQLAVLSIMEDVSQIRKHGSHYRFMMDSKNAGLAKLNIPIYDPEQSIMQPLSSKVQEMISDVSKTSHTVHNSAPTIHCGDFLNMDVDSQSVDAIITSPPYLNRNNYIAQQKGELSLMGLVAGVSDYQSIVDLSVISHVDGKRTQSDKISPLVQSIIEHIVISPGNNKKIPQMIAGYFYDMKQTISLCSKALKPGGVMAVIVGNVRWGGVAVPVDHLLFKLAEGEGLLPKKLLITRMKGNSPQQMKRYGRIPMRESILILKKA